MYVPNPGATPRLPFFWFFRANARPAPAAGESRSATLSDHELRRLVAAMVD